MACPAQKDQALALRSVHENKVLERVRVDLLEIEQLVPDDVEYFRVRLRLVLDPAVLSGRRESDVLDFALELVGRVLYYALLSCLLVVLTCDALGVSVMPLSLQRARRCGIGGRTGSKRRSPRWRRRRIAQRVEREKMC